MPDSHPIIAREGWPHVLIVLGLAVLATWLIGWWSLILWAVLIFVLQFFRDPSRSISGGAESVLAPADGRIVFVGKSQDPYLKREALKISIFMNVFNVHSNRSPSTGTVVDAWYSAGSFLNAALDKASAENERNALHIRTDTGVDITCVQIAGLVARRILSYVKSGDHLTAGQRYGFIRFGSRVDVYLPGTAVARVTIGDGTKAGISVIGQLPGTR